MTQCEIYQNINAGEMEKRQCNAQAKIAGLWKGKPIAICGRHKWVLRSPEFTRIIPQKPEAK